MCLAGLAAAIQAWASETGRQSACVILVRHGATVWNADRRIQGQTDVELSPLGIAQTGEVATAVKSAASPVAIYSSPLVRAAHTAAVIGNVIQVAVITRDDLKERAFGAMEGLTVGEADTTFPLRRQDETTIPGIEPFSALQERAMQAITGIMSAHAGQQVVVVSHGGFINAFLARISDGKVGSGVTNLTNGGISVVWRHDTSWCLGVVNYTAHLSHPTGQTLQPK